LPLKHPPCIIVSKLAIVEKKYFQTKYDQSSLKNNKMVK